MVSNPCTLGSTSDTDAIQSTSISRQNTLPSTTVNTTPHYTRNTLPNVVVPQDTPNPNVQYATLPTQDGHDPSPYYCVSPINAAFKNHQPATHLPPPYSQVVYPPTSPNTCLVPGETLPQQIPQKCMTPQQPLYLQQLWDMNLQSNRFSTTQNNYSQVSQEPITISDTPTQNLLPQIESSSSFTGNSTTPVLRENVIDVFPTSIPIPQVSTIAVPPITTTTDNNSRNEAHGESASTEETYEVVGGPVVNSL